MSARSSKLVLDEVARAARELPGPVIEELARRLESAISLDAAAQSYVLSAVHQDASRRRMRTLLATWAAQAPEQHPAALAWALRGAHSMDTWHRRAQSLELVWTGPAPHGTVLRRTDQALLELVESARRRLLIVSFAAYRVPAVHDALVRANARGVALEFVFESPEESLGRVSTDPRLALDRELARRSKVWHWPLEVRERDERGRHGTLHAKCALADGERLLVSSANFTGDALFLNMELGVMIEGGALPGEVARHFDALMRYGVLKAPE